MGYYGGWAPYVSVAERRKKAEKEASKAKKSGASLSPIDPYRGAVAKTFWGKAWCDNLEAYSDYANRMPRGRTYVRNGSVIDLKITEGEIQAQVMGTSLYRLGSRSRRCQKLIGRPSEKTVRVRLTRWSSFCRENSPRL